MGGGGPRRPGALPLLALALLAAQGGSAPLQPGGSPALSKIYPRGSHWAVGHLMGKKSTGDFPYAYEEENKPPFSALPENMKQLEDYLQWEEISKHLLRLLERSENKSAHVLKGGLPWYTRNTWDTDDNSSWKNVSKKKPVRTLHRFTFHCTITDQLRLAGGLSREAAEMHPVH
uniref:Gastrin-releasing peptide n=1 Tax=Amazona collaria TaxID=241587 RepID=A0A8B9J117_9PSIT